MASIINAATSGGLVTSADTSGILQLQTASTTAVTVNASQNMGIGTASPSVRLQVEGTTDATQRIVVNGSGNYSSLKLQYNATEVAQFQNYQNSEVSIGATVSAPLLLVTNNTERARIPAAGGIQSKTTISVGDATPSASGAGITFPATQSASTNANTLDDYEEGTWEPVYNFSTSGAANTVTKGRYIKIGSSVWVQGYLYINSSTACTGDATITGLPFTSNTTSQVHQGFSIGVARRFNVDMPNLRIALVNNTTVLNLFKQATNSNGETTLTNTDFNVQAEFNILYFQGTYSV